MPVNAPTLPAVPRGDAVRLALATVLLPILSLCGCSVPDGGDAVPKIGVRNAHAMAYDGGRERIILFGGADASRVRGDTWEWDGESWRLLSTTGPEPRTFPAMAYDSVRLRVVLFGGNQVLFGKTSHDNRFLRDTWEWEGLRWTRVSAAGPPPRAEAAMCFDPRRGRVVLFGGYDRVGEAVHRLGDTWEWDGSQWMEIHAAGPSPRNGATAVYDNASQKVVLFGGATDDGVNAETWEWDGKVWLKKVAAVTEGRFNSVSAYDSVARKVIRFGGRFSGIPSGDTWEYDGQGWTRVSSTGPSPRNHTAMAYDRKRGKIVLFGGHNFGVRESATDVFGDTWEWDSRAWARAAGGPPQERIDNGH